MAPYAFCRIFRSTLPRSVGHRSVAQYTELQCNIQTDNQVILVFLDGARISVAESDLSEGEWDETFFVRHGGVDHRQGNLFSRFSVPAASFLPSYLWGNNNWFIMGGWVKSWKYFGTKSVQQAANGPVWMPLCLIHFWRIPFSHFFLPLSAVK